MLQPPQDHVRLGQLVAVAAGDQACIKQAVERLHRAAHAQVGIAAAVQELQGLYEELDLADAAAAELEIDARRAGGFLLGARLELAHLVDGLEVEVLAEHERDEPAQRFLAGVQIARDRAGLEQREAFPGGALGLVIELEAADGVDDGSAAPLGPQIEVDAEDESAFRRRARRAHRCRDGFREAGIEGEVIDRIGALRPSILVIDVEDVCVGGEVQLLASQLSHPEDAETRRTAGAAVRRRPVQRAEPAVVELHRRLERALGKAREIPRHVRDGAAREIVEGDPQHLDLLVGAQPARKRDRVFAARGAQRSGPFREAARGEQIEEARAGGDDLREKPRCRADPDERRKRLA